MGNIGSDIRMDYTVIGDSVNVCARLQGLGKTYGCEILVGEGAYEKTKHAFLYRTIDLVALRGKQKGIYIYELLAGHGKNEAVKPSNQLKLLAKTSQEGFIAYQSREWDKAEACYQKILEISPGDKAAGIFIRRIASYKKMPPPEDWEGVFHF